MDGIVCFHNNFRLLPFYLVEEKDHPKVLGNGQNKSLKIRFCLERIKNGY